MDYAAQVAKEKKEEVIMAEGPGKKWTLEEAVASVNNLSGADIANGKRMYKAVLCAKCHTHSGVGGSSGPNLTRGYTKSNYRSF